MICPPATVYLSCDSDENSHAEVTFCTTIIQAFQANHAQLSYVKPGHATVVCSYAAAVH